MHLISLVINRYTMLCTRTLRILNLTACEMYEVSQGAFNLLSAKMCTTLTVFGMEGNK